MELIYQNDYGAVYKIPNSPNPSCEMQMVIDSIGLFMSRPDLDHLLKVVLGSHVPCYCGQCQGKCSKIWCTNPFIDICLKVDETVLRKIEDLIKGTQFILNIDNILEPHRPHGPNGNGAKSA